MAPARAPRRALWRRALATGAVAAGAQPVEVPVSSSAIDGLFAARIEVGDPPQRLWAAIDSGSPWLWVSTSPDGKKHGYRETDQDASASSAGSLDSINYADGVKVAGHIVSEKVKLGAAEVEVAPLFLARNASRDRAPLARLRAGAGTLGLALRDERATEVQHYEGRGSGIFGVFGPERRREEDDGKKLKGFFKAFWEAHPEVPQTFFLSLGGSSPSMTVGADLVNGVGPTKLTFLADVFTKRSASWYTSVRAIGLSMGQAAASSGSLVWNLDFNKFSLEGAPARLDTGSRAIRVCHYVFQHLLANMGDGSCKEAEDGIDCPCNPSAIEATFPWISISFETHNNVRFLGFDTGRDTRVCIPPSAYVTPSSQAGRCSLAIVDAGVYQRFFGLEGIVLGVPFFKAVSVGVDVGRQLVGIGGPLSAPPGAAAADTETEMSAPGEMAVPGETEAGEAVAVPQGVGMGATPGAQAACLCADPKNWWQTGHRFSATRCAVVLFGTAMTLAYVFVAHSPSAEGLRSQLDGLMGSHGPSPLSGGAPNRGANEPRPTPDRPFVQMTGGPYGGPE